ncbi:MAG: integration host factor subunit beta [Deltaproteobacteria bacterium]|nr:integration host factor subunit beta [Deltaproteobacteria bacterium]
MTKSDLIEKVAENAQLTKDKAALVVNAIFDRMVDAMKDGERIEIRNFGNFTVRHYESYTGRNPKTGEPVSVGPKRMPFFKVGLDLKRRVNGESAAE